MEIFGIPARDFAAYWGAGLSTVLAVSVLVHPRPTVTLRAVKSEMGQQYLRLRVKNNARHPVMLGKLRTLGAQAAIQTGSIDGWELKDVFAHVLRKRLDVLIEPSSTFEVDLTFAPEPERLFLLLTWHSHRMFTWPWLPTFMVRGDRAMKALRQHPVPESTLNK